MKDLARRRRTRPLLLGGVFLVVSLVYVIILAVLELCKASRLRLAGTQEDCTVTSTQNEGEEEMNITVDGY